MQPNDISSDVMQPAVDRQKQDTARVQHRIALQAKFFLVLSTALFSSYVTYAIYRYLTFGEINAISVLLFFVFATVLIGRWRAA